jgi:hypothetical protein
VMEARQMMIWKVGVTEASKLVNEVFANARPSQWGCTLMLGLTSAMKKKRRQRGEEETMTRRRLQCLWEEERSSDKKKSSTPVRRTRKQWWEEGKEEKEERPAGPVWPTCLLKLPESWDKGCAALESEETLTCSLGLQRRRGSNKRKERRRKVLMTRTVCRRRKLAIEVAAGKKRAALNSIWCGGSTNWTYCTETLRYRCEPGLGMGESKTTFWGGDRRRRDCLEPKVRQRSIR